MNSPCSTSKLKDRNKIFPDRRTVETILETLDRYKVECDQRGIDLDTGKAIYYST